MKHLFFIIAIAFSISSFAQTEKKSTKITIPTEVKDAFSKEFPGKKAKWEMENGSYEAEFKMNKTNASAVYDAKGNRKELEIDIKISALQTSILDYVKKNYTTAKIIEAAKITNDKNEITYEAEIKKEGKSYDVLFDASGKFIKIVDAD